MKLNCDLGEGLVSAEAKDASVDAQLMPYIDQANIACGFHAGDPQTMVASISLAKSHGVSIGAHPSYADRAGFGRRSVQLSKAEIVALVQYQIAALDGLCRSHETQLCYVKPHGALYNDMISDNQVLDAVMSAVASYPAKLALMMLASSAAEQHQLQASKLGLSLLFEGFADRRYADDGTLTPRTEPGAVLDKNQTLQQAISLLKRNEVTTASGARLPLLIDSLCVHGDNPDAIQCVKSIRAELQQTQDA